LSSSATVKKTNICRKRVIYTQLNDFESDEYHSAVAKSVEKARKLLEVSFEPVVQKRK
jgi:hypothetical protein